MSSSLDNEGKGANKKAHKLREMEELTGLKVLVG